MLISVDRFGAALRLVESLADLADPADYPGHVLPRLARLIDCDVLTYNEIGPEVRYRAYPDDALDPATAPTFAAYVHQHPLINHYRSTNDGRPVRMSDLVTRSQFHALPLYTEFFRPIPVEYQLAATLSEPGFPVLVGLAFNRDQRDFTDDEQDLLALLRAPLMTALVRAVTRHDARCALRRAHPDRLDALTDQERRVLDLVASGRTNTAIAHTLDISPRTVAKHLEHVYRKLDVSNRAAAVATTRDPG